MKKGREIPSPKADFSRKVKDVLIFKLRSDTIDRRGSLGSDDDVLSDAMCDVSAEECGSYSPVSIVNLLFIHMSGESHKLFKSDRLISSMDFYCYQQDNEQTYSGYSRYSLDKNLYITVDEDSNGDGFLSKDDQQDLYASDYDGTNLELIMEDISEYKVIDDNEVMILRKNGKTEDFYLYNAESNKLVKLNTQV